MILDLCYYGNPILRQKAEPVEELTDEILELCHNMIETLNHHNAIGLAANQVGVLKRIFISNVVGEDEEGNILLGEPIVYINPILTHPSELCEEREEACLSLPKLMVPVIRPVTIDLEAMDMEGKIFHEKCHDFVARNRMHENDHLNGVLTIDRLKGKRRRALDAPLRVIKIQYGK